MASPVAPELACSNRLHREGLRGRLLLQLEAGLHEVWLRATHEAPEVVVYALDEDSEDDRYA